MLTGAHLKRAAERGGREVEPRDFNLWETADFRDCLRASRELTGHEANSRHNTIHQLPPCDAMDKIRRFFTRMKKGGKKHKRKLDRLRAEVRGPEGTSSLLRPVPHVKVGGDHDREDHGAGVEEREVSQKNPHPDVGVAEQSPPSRKESDVDGKKTDRPIELDPSASSTSHRGEPEGTWRSISRFLPLIVSLDNADDSVVPDHVQKSRGLNQNEPNTTSEKKSNWESTASATAKLLLREVRDSTDAFGPLKSVAGGLCSILEDCEVRPSSPTCYPPHLSIIQGTKGNEQAIESLAPRIKALSALFCTPVSGDDMKERSRRGELAR